VFNKHEHCDKLVDPAGEIDIVGQEVMVLPEQYELFGHRKLQLPFESMA
jgi:hypothetical protein